MATKNGTPVAGKVIAGRGGNGGRHGRSGLRVQVAAGVMALGCAAVLALGGVRTADTEQIPAQANTAAPVAQADDLERQHFLEQNYWLPTAGNGASLAPAALDWERILFLEGNVMPDGAIPGPADGPLCGTRTIGACA